MIKKLLYIPIIAICCSCSKSSDTEKYRNKSDHIIFVKEKINEINFQEVLISQYARLYLINDYLLIADGRSLDKLIHIFDKKSFRYIAGVADRGQGPGDIANIGFVGVNESDNTFYVNDHGKQKIFGYRLDSVLANPLYMPEVKMTMNEKQFPSKYQFINDTLLMGVTIVPAGNSGFDHATAKINMNTGEIIPILNKHPKVTRKRISFAASPEHGIYVECYNYHDLMTIYDLNGNLKYNLYGRKWNDKTTNRFGYYEKVLFCKDKIVALYSDAKNRYSDAENSSPTQFLIFNTDGDYIQTLETEFSILDFCYDMDNHRIIMHLNDEIQFACLYLAGLVE
ncbi:MAG: 6-bladed beta-propeller [Tannerella sp.]|jgi:hypothetical protein|nr:6-bladed beta-propeller [Tannerella sp.]